MWFQLYVFSVLSESDVCTTRRPNAQHPCIHGNSFYAQTKMAEEEKSVVSTTLKLVIIFIGPISTS